MNKAILDLKKDCLNNSIPCSQLLLKAYAIAKTMHIDDMANFCKNEMDGYQDNPTCIPAYRVIHIDLQLNDGYNWHSIALPNDTSFAEHHVLQTIKELEDLCFGTGSEFRVKLSTQQLEIIRKVFKGGPIYDGQKILSASQLNGIIFKVKEILLEWALKLAKDDDREENLEFTSNDTGKVKNTTIINNYGNINGANFINSMTNSSATINNNNNFDFEVLKQLVAKIEADLENAKNIEAEKANSLKEQIASLKTSVEEQNETSAMDLLKNIAAGAISSGIWSIGTTITTFLSSLPPFT